MNYADKMKESTFIGLRDVAYVPAHSAVEIAKEADARIAALEAQVAEGRKVIGEFIENEVATEASGDCGHWDVESSDTMKAARKFLEATK